MIVGNQNNAVQIFDFNMNIESFSQYLEVGIGIDGVFAQTENIANQLIIGNFQHDLSEEFVRSVCAWGRDTRVSYRVLRDNQIIEISNVLQISYTSTTNGNIRKSLEDIQSLRNLGISFGTKHLKFLCPDAHVVLDRVIENRLGFARNSAGYMAWRGVCLQILDIVRNNQIAYPGTGQNGWRVADIEMAIFNRIRDV